MEARDPTYLCLLLIFLGTWMTQAIIYESSIGHHSRLQKRSANEENETVRVEQGLLRGRRVQSAAGGSFISFLGIPYAKPPLGSLRFKDAKHPLHWEGIRDAFVEGNECPQLLGSVVGSEDCLYLNVYIPRPSSNRSNIAVMVWFHGGGFVRGSSSKEVWGPDYLIAQDVIIVTTNYRLGVFGFLYLNEAAPGNVGLKDQVAALRWVKRNIAAFGGDPEKVTIFGESAGGASVHLHMLSPMSRGLFHAAIAQSGNAFNRWGIQTSPLETSNRLATAVGCPVGNNSATVECLRRVEVKPLIEAAFTRAATEDNRDRIILYSFVPTVDLPVPGVETFLPASVIQLVTEGRHHAVPFLTGFNNNESLLHYFFLNLFDENIAHELDERWNTTFIPELRLPISGSKSERALLELRNFFMNRQPLTNATFPGFMNMLTDIAFAEGIYYSVKNMVKHNKSELYLYSFILEDSLNAGKVQGNFTSLKGAAHGDELGYLFRMGFLPTVSRNSSADKARFRMVRLWTNFAKFRNPTPTDDQLLPHWKQYSPERNYL